ncbi:peptidase S8 and S53 subtilisin kexin sedolisin [halophilic archaeon]|nr:peptidase S8 and S53 subtilisin kexin sedolisin [halophilic archaeon]
MYEHSRRTVLKTGAALVGGVAAGTTVTTAESRGRYVVDTASVGDEQGIDVVHRLDQVGLSVVRASERDVKRLGERYAADVVFSRARPTRGGSVSATESARDEPLYSLQWDKHDQHVPEVHEHTRGEGARVAIIDTGVAAGHPDLRHAVDAERSRNFTEDSLGAPGPYGGYHGTHVAGIVAANDRNERGVVGSAPGAEIVDCRVFSETAPQETLSAFFGDVLAAIVYSADVGADAANLSLGAYFTREGLGSFWGKALNRTTTYANRRGTLLVHAAGNVSVDLQHDKGFVDSSESAQGLGVSATGPVGFGWGEDGLEEPYHSPTFYTNYGTNAVDLGAPGGNASEAILSMKPENRPAGWRQDFVLNCLAVPSFGESGEYQGATYEYGYLAGTSMAAPQVTAAAALVASVNPRYNANQVESALTRTAAVPEGYEKAYYGSGYLDPLEAVTE